MLESSRPPQCTMCTIGQLMKQKKKKKFQKIRRWILFRKQHTHTLDSLFTVKTMIFVLANSRRRQRRCVFFSFLLTCTFQMAAKKKLFRTTVRKGTYEATTQCTTTRNYSHLAAALSLATAVSFTLTHSWLFVHMFTFYWPTYLQSYTVDVNFATKKVANVTVSTSISTSCDTSWRQLWISFNMFQWNSYILYQSL